MHEYDAFSSFLGNDLVLILACLNLDVEIQAIWKVFYADVSYIPPEGLTWIIYEVDRINMMFVRGLVVGEGGGRSEVGGWSEDGAA